MALYLQIPSGEEAALWSCTFRSLVERKLHYGPVPSAIPSGEEAHYGPVPSAIPRSGSCTMALCLQQSLVERKLTMTLCLQRSLVERKLYYGPVSSAIPSGEEVALSLVLPPLVPHSKSVISSSWLSTYPWLMKSKDSLLMSLGKKGSTMASFRMALRNGMVKYIHCHTHQLTWQTFWRNHCYYCC